MKCACEVCLEHGSVRPHRDYREVETVQGLIGMYVCGPHSSALTALPEYQEREAEPVNRHTRIHVDPITKRASAHEVQ